MTIQLLIGANALMMLMFVLRFYKLPPQIPLFYSQPWGNDQLTELWMILLLPIIMNMLFFGNNFLIKKLFSNDALAKKIVFALNIFIVATTLFIFLRILILVS